MELSPNEIRVIGCLMEKSVTTPDQYPLSLNALTNACNQKSSRDPVLRLEPGTVQHTVNGLIDQHLVARQNYGSRVDKYVQRFCNTEFARLQFSDHEFAIMCLLLLRGAQTPGELKSRSGSLCKFGDVAEVEAALENLMTREDGPFVARLPPEPRRRDYCYTHLMSGAIESVPKTADLPARQAPRLPPGGAIAALEARVGKLERELADLRRLIGADTAAE